MEKIYAVAKRSDAFGKELGLRLSSDFTDGAHFTKCAASRRLAERRLFATIPRTVTHLARRLILGGRTNGKCPGGGRG